MKMKDQLRHIKQSKKIEEGSRRLTKRLQKIYNGDIEEVIKYKKLRGRYLSNSEEKGGSNDE